MSQSAGNALISVYDKTGIEGFAEGLADLGWKIYASGGTASRLSAAGVPVTDVADLVGGQAILGHRVVTLSREVHSGLLADKSRPEDLAELEALGIPVIDLVCVDMYPLETEIAKPDATAQDIIEKTDIGGPTMLRAAAKGRRIVLSAAEQRQPVLEWLRAGRPDEEAFIEQLVARAEYEVTRYTMNLATYLGGEDVCGYIARQDSPTKYGENPQQANAGFYADNRITPDPLGLDNFVQAKGWERSYVNMTDLDRLLQTLTHIAAGYERNFGEVPPMAVGVKHGNACGAAVGETMVEAVQKMLEGDTRAIFGGVVMLNGTIDEPVADALMRYKMDDGASRLLDGVVGASVTDGALEILSRKKLRIITNPALANLSEKSLDDKRRIRPVRGGVLVQPNYTYVHDFSAAGVTEFGNLSSQQRRDMVLAWAIGSTSNSNTITLVKAGQLIGNGVGQQDRVGAGQLAISRTTISAPTLSGSGQTMKMTILLDGDKLAGAVAYSDSFFPFSDGPELLADAGVRAILTSSGSVADDDVVKALTSRGVAVVMVPDKVGRGFYMH